jgi:hypothetical protein
MATGPDQMLTLLDAVEAAITGPAPSRAAVDELERAIAECEGSSGATSSAAGEAEVVAYARFMCALGWLVLSGGRGNDPRSCSQADRQLFQLGFRWRLNSRVFTGRFGESDDSGGPAVMAQISGEGASVLRRVAAVDGAIPTDDLAALRRGFSPGQPFWTEHAYDSPTCPFFSYLYMLESAPANAVERVAQLLVASGNKQQSHSRWHCSAV